MDFNSMHNPFTAQYKTCVKHNSHYKVTFSMCQHQIKRCVVSLNIYTLHSTFHDIFHSHKSCFTQNMQPV